MVGTGHGVWREAQRVLSDSDVVDTGPIEVASNGVGDWIAASSKGVWVNGGRVGLIFECINLLVDKAPVKSPWGQSD